MTHTLYEVFFSPTKTTEAITHKVARSLAHDCSLGNCTVNLTKPDKRPTPLTSTSDDVLVFGFPVYGGRVPTVLMESIALLKGQKTPAVLLGVYGNRAYDDALVEAADLLAGRGFIVRAAGAFIGEHSMAVQVGAGRPDTDDLATAAQFGHDIAGLVKTGRRDVPFIKGNRPYRAGMPDADLRPTTTDACTACGVCVSQCPLGIIDAADPAKVASGCLRCNACVKSCPEHAKLFTGEQVKQLVALLESTCQERKEPELFW